MEINFTYNSKIDSVCWKRYNDFIKKNKDVWGIKRKPNQILSFKKIELAADIKNIVKVYNKIFSTESISIKGYIVTTPFSMINDDKKFSAKNGVIYLSLFSTDPYLVLAHEIFHIYFEKYTKRNIPNYDEAKEYFTIIMNDLFKEEISRGYTKHQIIRQKIFDKWKQTKSLDACIELLYEK